MPVPSETPSPDKHRVGYHYEMDTLLGTTDLDEQLDNLDPMSNPLSAGYVGSFLMLGLQQTGIAKPVIGALNEKDDPDPANVPAESVLFLQARQQVYLGPFDGASLQSAVDEGSFTETGTSGVYAHDEQEQVVTWGSGYVVVGPSEELVTTVVDTATGGTTPWYQASSEFRWLLENGANGGYTVVMLNDEPLSNLGNEDSSTEFQVFEGANGFAQTANVGGQGKLSDAGAAVVYPSQGDVRLDRLKSGLGADASDITFDQSGKYVTVDAAYGGGEVGDDTPTGTPDGTSGTGTEDGGEESTQTSDEGTSDGGDDDDDGDDDGTSQEVPGMGIVGTLAGLVGGGYLLAKDRDERE
jgi:hypothetical protein